MDEATQDESRGKTNKAQLARYNATVSREFIGGTAEELPGPIGVGLVTTAESTPSGTAKGHLPRVPPVAVTAGRV